MKARRCSSTQAVRSRYYPIYPSRTPKVPAGTVITLCNCFMIHPTSRGVLMVASRYGCVGRVVGYDFNPSLLHFDLQSKIRRRRPRNKCPRKTCPFLECLSAARLCFKDAAVIDFALPRRQMPGNPVSLMALICGGGGKGIWLFTSRYQRHRKCRGDISTKECRGVEFIHVKSDTIRRRRPGHGLHPVFRGAIIQRTLSGFPT